MMLKTIFYNVREGYGLFFKNHTGIFLPLRSLLASPSRAMAFQLFLIKVEQNQGCRIFDRLASINLPITNWSRVYDKVSLKLVQHFFNLFNANALFKLTPKIYWTSLFRVNIFLKALKNSFQSFPNLQRPVFLGGSAMGLCDVDLKVEDLDVKEVLVSPRMQERGAGKTPSRELVCALEGSFYLDFLNTFSSKEKVLSLRGDERTDYVSINDSYGLTSSLSEWSIPQGFLVPLGMTRWLKALWAGYQDRQRYRKEVQRRLLRQRAMKREKVSTPLSLTGEHWTDRFLKRNTVVPVYGIAGVPFVFSPFNWKLVFPLLLLFGILAYMPVMAKSDLDGAFNSVSDSITPLKVGDRVPDLKFSVYQDGEFKTVSLSDYKGKLVILDFWATWCSPCVAMIPKMDSLQNDFEGKVQFLSVAYQSRKIIQDYLIKLEKDRGLKTHIPQLTDDTQLAAWFPHNSLPHYVWINQKGTIAAITGYEAVNAENIDAALLQNNGGLVQKREAKRVDYDLLKPLFMDGNGGAVRPGYYRVFSGYQPGLSLRFRMQPQGDSLMVITGTNQNIASLFSMAYSNGKGMIPKKRIVLQSAYPERLRSDAHGQPYRDWMAEGNVFCYELRVPIENQSKAFELMQQDLDLLFPRFKGRLEKKMIPCLVLKAMNDKGSYLTKGGDPEMHFDLNGAFMQNAYLNHLIVRLENYNLSKDPRPIINGVGNDVRVDLDLRCNLSDVKALNKALVPYGLTLVEQQKEIEVLVISDRKEAKL